MSELLALGTSHKTAPLALREKLALLDGGAEALIRELTGHDEHRRGRRDLHLQPHRALPRRLRPRRGRVVRAGPARAPRGDPAHRADGQHVLAAQLRRRAPPVPRDERPRVDDRRRGRGPGPGQARVRARARRPHDRADDQQALPRRAGHRQARAHRDGDLRRPRLRRLRRGRRRARRARRPARAPRRDRRRRRDRRADRAGAARPGRDARCSSPTAGASARSRSPSASAAPRARSTRCPASSSAPTS